MNVWVRRGISLLEIGGGAVGIVATAPFLFQPDRLKIVLGMVALTYYLFGIGAGLLLAESNPKGLVSSKIYQFIQIPLVSSSFIGYSIASGAYMCLIVDKTGIDIRGFLGSSLDLSILHPDSPWAIGINLVGLAAFLLLRKSGKKN